VNTKRFSFVMMGILSVLILGIFGVAYMANGLLEKKSGTLSDLKLRTRVLEEERLSLARAKKDVEKYAPLAQIAKSIVPQDKDQAQAVREIVKLASESGITPSTITFPTSNLGAAVAPGAAVPGGAAAGNKNLTQLTPVVGAPGLYTLQITITQSTNSPVPYSKFLDFLSKLEQNRRTAQVSNIVLKPVPASRDMLSYTLTVDSYIKP
jgi:hypothetical protein